MKIFYFPTRFYFIYFILFSYKIAFLYCSYTIPLTMVPQKKVSNIFRKKLIPLSRSVRYTNKDFISIQLDLGSHQNTYLPAKKYKGFTKLIKEICLPWYFPFLRVLQTFDMSFILPAWFVRSICFFRHPYRLCHLLYMTSVIRFICHL
jgi:hypothetical protein